MIKHYFFLLIAALAALLQLTSCAPGAATTSKGISGYVNADDPNIQYIGRFNFTNPAKVTYDWPGVYIHAKFEGTSCSVRLNDPKNEYAVIIDSRAPRILSPDSINNIYMVASGLADSLPHTITIVKRSESLFGKGEFQGFVLDRDRNLLPPGSRPERRIEFIGNSITCGYGVEGDSAACHFSLQTENADLSYATMSARELNADYLLVAYSGRGMVRNYGDKNKTSVDPMPELYKRTCFNDSTSRWDFTKWIPQAVVINLGTNDFSTQPFPDKDVFQNAYTDLISRVRNQYPGVNIFCICGPMIGEPCMTYVREVVEKEKQLKRDRDVFFVPIPLSIMSDKDWGSDMHPNVSGMIKMKEALVKEIKARMNW